MPNCFDRAFGGKVTNDYVSGALNDPKAADNPNVHMLIIGLDYKETSFPLTCSLDANNMLDLAQACGVTDLNVMLNTECTKERVRAKIAEVGGRCQAEEFFVIYYAGHGERVEDQDHDEDDGYDEALVLVNEQGQFEIPGTFLTDDEFAECITDSIAPEVRVLVIMDCCHSGTIADLDRDIWEGFEAISICGCTDVQESQDMGKGGVFTHALLMGLDNLQNEEQDEYSVGMAFNMALKFDQEVFNSSQDLTIQMSSCCSSESMAWPLVPRVRYTSPFKRVRQRKRAVGDVNPTPQELWRLGIPPSMAATACDESKELSLGIPAGKNYGKCSVQ